MDRKRAFQQRLSQVSEAAAHCLPGNSLVEIAGDKRVLIENHCGVKEYGHEQILVKVPLGCISISGCNLILTKMTKEQLVVCGQINGIHLHRKERP